MHATMRARLRAEHPAWTEAALTRVASRYSAPPHDRVPPPHVTGGAVDLMLADCAGAELDHCSPYDPGDPRCFPFDAPGLSEEARRVRAILAHALLSSGLTNYPTEFWHWSYGDQGWAYRGGHDHAIYGAIAPPGFLADPTEDVDDPLAFIAAP
jgi:D-alanyl-D-alanine dipeptidase